jgi:adenosylcobinamide-GDP ribazoletransferase
VPLAKPRQLVLFLLATQFLTRLPTPAMTEAASSGLPQSARYFPLVGVLVGLINVGIWWLSIHWLPATVSIGLMLAASLLLTGALHEDGFADACDGFGGGTTAERVLEIMKDSRLGAYGALGIVVLLGLKWSVLVAIPAGAFPLLVVGAHMFSRWCAVGVIRHLRYVRIDVDAKAAPFAQSLSAREWILSGVLGVLGLAPLVYAREALSTELEGAVLLGAVAAAIATVLAAAYFRGRIGGYTGDCLGAVQQLTELAFLLAGLAVLSPVRRIV